jgi:outer membrane protein assembly factor BamA
MNRFALILLASVELTFIPVASVAQSESTTSSATVVGCQSDSTPAKPVLKRREPTRDNSSEPQTVKQKSRCKLASQTNADDPSKRTQIEFYGLTAIAESDALRLLRETQVFPANRPPDAESASTAAKTLAEALRSRGYAQAQVNALADLGTSVKFFVNEGSRFPIAETRFEGNRVFSSRELRGKLTGCLTQSQGGTANNYDRDVLEWCERILLNDIRSSGYLEAKMRHATEVKEAGYVVSFELDEGTLYRLGKIKIEGSEVLSEDQIKSRFSLLEGDIAKGDSISKWLFEDLKRMYAELGFIEYTAEPIPTFRRAEGIVDLDIKIDEGNRFSLQSISFVGDFIPGPHPENFLTIRVGDVFNQTLLWQSIARLNECGLFEPIDADKDVDFRTNQEEDLVSLSIKLRKRKP